MSGISITNGSSDVEQIYVNGQAAVAADAGQSWTLDNNTVTPGPNAFYEVERRAGTNQILTGTPTLDSDINAPGSADNPNASVPATIAVTTTAT